MNISAVKPATSANVLFAILLSLSLSATGQPALASDFDAWLGALRDEAAGKGISASTLDTALQGLRPIPRVIELDRQQPEFTQTFWNYLGQRVTEDRIARGRKLLEEHRDLLAKVEKQYGVPPRFLVAFWGLETNFGSYLGAFPVVGSLATLAHDHRRDAFFRAQLLDALHILDEGSVTVADMKGSWAGAVGHMQFMPSTFLQYAIDATGDGKRDLWGSLPDAFSSAANYLNRLGWRSDEIWGREVKLPKDFLWDQADLSIKKPIAEWAKMGVRKPDGGPLPKADVAGAIVLPQGYQGPAFLVYRNFDVIMNWNRSINYAVTVGYLADRFVGLPRIRHGRDADNRPLSREQALALQSKLNELGYPVGTPDGIPGAQTRTAIRAFQRDAGLPQDGYPSVSMLEKLNERRS